MTSKFRNWLNIVDATIGYDNRRENGTVVFWRVYFNAGYSEYEAIREILNVSEIPYSREADRIDGYDRDDLGESPDF